MFRRERGPAIRLVFIRQPASATATHRVSNYDVVSSQPSQQQGRTRKKTRCLGCLSGQTCRKRAIATSQSCQRLCNRGAASQPNNEKGTGRNRPCLVGTAFLGGDLHDAFSISAKVVSRLGLFHASSATLAWRPGKAARPDSGRIRDVVCHVRSYHDLPPARQRGGDSLERGGKQASDPCGAQSGQSSCIETGNAGAGLARSGAPF